MQNALCGGSLLNTVVVGSSSQQTKVFNALRFLTKTLLIISRLAAVVVVSLCGLKTASIRTGPQQRSRRRAQMILIMKLTFILLTAAMLSVHASGLSQNITLVIKQGSLESIFNQVEKKTNYVFFYKKELLNDTKPVTIEVHNLPVEEFLKRVLAGQPLEFSIENNAIIISRKKLAGDLKPAPASSPASLAESPPITVHGRIVNEKGEPAVAVIVVKGTNKGAVTEADGSYVLENVDENAILVVSGVAIETQEIKVKGRSEINISVVIKISSEQEVVISTGYFSSTKRRSTANISRVDAKDIEKQPVSSPLMALQGRMPGVDITPAAAGNAPGSAIKISIRGQNNLRPGVGTLPLYVIDGVPMDPTPLSSAGNFYLGQGFDPLSAINPANIDNIQVLKDASATAIYGSRGANGVVLITTKQGDKTGRSSLSMNAYTGVAAITNRLELLNRRQYLDLRYKAFENDGIDWRTAPLTHENYDLKTWDTTRSTDWQDLLLGNTSTINDAQINFSGGNGKTNFRVGGGYHKETSPANSDFYHQRITGNFSLNHTSANNKLKIQTNIDYGVSKTRQYNTENYLIYAMTLPPIAPAIYNEDGSLNWEIEDIGGLRNTFDNPLASLLRTHQAQTRNLVCNSTVSYGFLRDIDAIINIGFTQTDQDETTKSPITSLSPTSINSNTKGSATFGSNARTGFIFEPQLKYSNNFKKHSLQVMFGTSWQGSEYNYTNLSATLYNSDALLNSPQGAGRVVANSDKRYYRYNAFYGHIGYSYNDRYILDISGRRDGSSRFGPGKRFGNFGAAGAAWIFSDEQYIHDRLPFLSYGKLRASYGITGNDQIGDYKYLNTYSIGIMQYQGSLTLYPNGIYNPDYAWEETKKLEAALEIGMFDNRVSADVVWYRNRTSNQLVDYTLPFTTGFPSIFKNFEATVENSGWEFNFGAQVVRNNNVKWEINANFTLPKTRLVSFPGIETSPYVTQYKVGEPLTLFNSYTFKGVNTQTGKLEFEDRDQSGTYTEVDRSLKRVGRINYGGINNIVSWKKIQFSLFLQYSNSYQQFILPGSVPGLKANQLIGALNYWQKPGDHTNYPIPSQTAASTNLYGIYNQSYGSVSKITFLRLKTVNLSYDVKKIMPVKWNVQDCRVFIQGFNLLTVNGGNYLDPESGYAMPPLKMINIGVQVKL